MKLNPNYGVEVLSAGVTQGFFRSVNLMGVGASVTTSGSTANVTIAGGAGPQIVSVVAVDTIAEFDPVTILGNKADSGNSAHLGKVIGLSQAATAIGFVASVIVEGLAINGAWSWTPGAPIFLNGTTLSQTAPSTGFVQEIGIAKASDTIYVDLSMPVKL